MREDLAEILLTEKRIQQRLDELARQIQQDFTGADLTLIAVLTGGVMFVADLLRRLTLPLRLDFLGIASYHGTTRSSGQITFTKSLSLDVRGRDVLVVDDILDTGLTLARVREMVVGMQPRRVKFGVFLEKDVPHHPGAVADYVAFRIPDKFVVGYGLDYRERYRNLPFVGVLKPSVVADASSISPPEKTN